MIGSLSMWLLIGVSVVLSIFYFWVLYRTARSDELRIWFFLLVFAPVVLNIAVYLASNPFSAVVGFLMALVVLERFLMSLTAYEAAGENRIVWFLLIVLFPFFGWFLYRVTNLA
jgi:hypothetical protein